MREKQSYCMYVHTLHLGQFLALCAHTLHMIECLQGSNLTSAGASHTKHSSMARVGAPVVMQI